MDVKQLMRGAVIAAVGALCASRFSPAADLGVYLMQDAEDSPYGFGSVEVWPDESKDDTGSVPDFDDLAEQLGDCLYYGDHADKAAVKLSAFPDSGHSFAGWYVREGEAWQPVSSDYVHEFKTGAGRSLIGAKFVPDLDCEDLVGCELPDGRAGEEYEFVYADVRYRDEIGWRRLEFRDLPDGVEQSVGENRVCGTPTKAGFYTVSIEVEGNDGSVTNVTRTIRIEAAEADSSNEVFEVELVRGCGNSGFEWLDPEANSVSALTPLPAGLAFRQLTETWYDGDGGRQVEKYWVLDGAPTEIGETTTTVRVKVDEDSDPETFDVRFSVKDLPGWAVGARRMLMVGEDALYAGFADVTVSADGKCKVKAALRHKTFAFSSSLAVAYGSSDADSFVVSFCKGREGAAGHCYFSMEMGKFGSQAGAGCVVSAKRDRETGEMVVVSEDAVGTEFLPILEAVGPFASRYYTIPLRGTGCGTGYLTVAIAAKGTAKIAGKLPDGTSVSLTSPIFAGTDGNAVLLAYAPLYSKKGDCGVQIELSAEGGGAIADATWVRPPELVIPGEEGLNESAELWGIGRLYAAPSDLSGKRWNVRCETSGDALLPYEFKDWDVDDKGRDVIVRQEDEYANPAFECENGYVGNVRLLGQAKGKIALAGKSSAPWKETVREDGEVYVEWHYDKTKFDEPIADPSQLTFSFSGKTGVFSGKFKVYFDYEMAVPKKIREGGEWNPDYVYKSVHKVCSVPFSGVMVATEDGDGLQGEASCVFKTKRSELYEYEDSRGNWKRKFLGYAHVTTFPLAVEPVADAEN